MKIETKFNVGDEVFLIDKDTASQVVIEGIVIGLSNNISYSVVTAEHYYFHNVQERSLYATEEKARQVLVKMMELELEKLRNSL